MTTRQATLTRATRETSVTIALSLDGRGEASISTGIGFLDHMLTALTRHARWDLTLTVNGDLHIDDHHTAEDTAIALGEALDCALGQRRDFARFGAAYAPLDEALARSVVDVSSRPGAFIALGLKREMLGTIATENLTHFFNSFATAARLTLHVDVLKGDNDHHRAEAAFKSLALALRQALAIDTSAGLPSTKEAL